MDVRNNYVCGLAGSIGDFHTAIASSDAKPLGGQHWLEEIRPRREVSCAQRTIINVIKQDIGQLFAVLSCSSVSTVPSGSAAKASFNGA